MSDTEDQMLSDMIMDYFSDDEAELMHGKQFSVQNIMLTTGIELVTLSNYDEETGGFIFIEPFKIEVHSTEKELEVGTIKIRVNPYMRFTGQKFVYFDENFVMTSAVPNKELASLYIENLKRIVSLTVKEKPEPVKKEEVVMDSSLITAEFNPRVVQFRKDPK